MCKIIEFKPRQRNGYLNLKELFEICNNVKSCDFYLGLVEYLYKNRERIYIHRKWGNKSRMDAKWKPGFATVEIITGSGRR